MTRARLCNSSSSRIGYVFQNADHQIFAPSVREEIAFGPRNLSLDRAQVEARVEAALATFDLTALADLPPATLGYGQRRLVTLAAVHAMQPQVLLLDEPTVGLDRRLTACFAAWASEFHAGGATIVLITQDMRLVAQAPRCVVMDHGRVGLNVSTVEVFTHSDRLARAGLAPPPIVELSRQLGLLVTPLTADDFSRIYARVMGEVGTS